MGTERLNDIASFAQAAARNEVSTIVRHDISAMARVLLPDGQWALFNYLTQATNDAHGDYTLLPANTALAVDDNRLHTGYLMAICPQGTEPEENGYVSNAGSVTALVLIPVVGTCSLMPMARAPKPERLMSEQAMYVTLAGYAILALELLAPKSPHNGIQKTLDWAKEHIANGWGGTALRMSEMISSNHPKAFPVGDRRPELAQAMMLHAALQRAGWLIGRIPVSVVYAMAQQMLDDGVKLPGHLRP
jgi:hypothetical protein